MERCRHVELGRGMRYVRYLQGTSDGRLFTLPSRKEGFVRQTGLCSGLGRLQSFLSLLLHVVVDQAE